MDAVPIDCDEYNNADVEICAVKILKKSNNIVFSIYRPPTANSAIFFQTLHSILKKSHSSPGRLLHHRSNQTQNMTSTTERKVASEALRCEFQSLTDILKVIPNLELLANHVPNLADIYQDSLNAFCQNLRNIITKEIASPTTPSDTRIFDSLKNIESKIETFDSKLAIFKDDLKENIIQDAQLGYAKIQTAVNELKINTANFSEALKIIPTADNTSSDRKRPKRLEKLIEDTTKGDFITPLIKIGKNLRTPNTDTHLMEVKTIDDTTMKEDFPALVRKNLKGTDVQIKKITQRKDTVLITANDNTQLAIIQGKLEEAANIKCNPVILKNPQITLRNVENDMTNEDILHDIYHKNDFIKKKCKIYPI
ncbi:unnamed protein product [Bemisia tabaci]|uniref:Uncharacterized protein n=1 Tax=Bemisia tabaci TaxID=7038 RepID=A0A9P0A5J4_BEMTA|nr:unnamed protein product [Bemisia tabaci]